MRGDSCKYLVTFRQGTEVSADDGDVKTAPASLSTSMHLLIKSSRYSPTTEARAGDRHFCNDIKQSMACSPTFPMVSYYFSISHLWVFRLKRYLP